MRKRMVCLILAFVLAFGSLTGSSALADVAGTSSFEDVANDYHIFPHADVIDATLIQGGSRELTFYAGAGFNDSSFCYCVAIYQGGKEEISRQLRQGKTRRLMNFFYLNSADYEAREKMTVTWKADSRYTPGDYTLFCYALNRNTEHVCEDLKLFTSELHVVSARRPADDLSVWLMKDDGWKAFDEDGILEVTSRCRSLPLIALPEPCPSTTRLDCSVFTSPDSVVADKYVKYGYIGLRLNKDGIARIRVVCGRLEKSFWLKKGCFDERTALTVYHSKSTLCMGETDKCIVRSKKNYDVYPTAALWSSSDPAVATVDSRGVVTALKPGKVRITAEAARYRQTLEYTVQYHTFSEDTPVTGRTATHPKQAAGRCTSCGRDGVVNIYEPAVFSDVEPEAWYSPHIDRLYDMGFMKGTGETIFSPDAEITRAMAATVLYRAAGEPITADGSAFSDVPEGTYYTRPVRWAQAAGLISGFPDGTFRPEESITREQLVTILFRYARANGRAADAGADLSRFPDAGAVHTYALESMRWAVGTGLITGETSGGQTRIRPDSRASRAQFAAVLSRFLAFCGDDPDTDASDPDAPGPPESAP